MSQWARLELIALTIAAGLASRRWDAWLPGLLHKNTGDVLWAILVFWLVGLLLPRRSLGVVVLCDLAFATGIEFLKLVNHPWLETLRHLPGARLVFGYVFSWSNLVCYWTGILLAAAVLFQLDRIRKDRVRERR